MLNKLFFYLLIISSLLSSNLHAGGGRSNGDLKNDIVRTQGSYHANQHRDTTLDTTFDRGARLLQFRSNNTHRLVQFLFLTTIMESVSPPDVGVSSSSLKRYNSSLAIRSSPDASFLPSDSIPVQNQTFLFHCLEPAYRQGEVCEPKKFTASVSPYVHPLQEARQQNHIFTLEETSKDAELSHTSKNPTVLAKNIASSGFQPIALEPYHRNGTCPILPIPLEEHYIPCSSSDNVFSSELRLPSAYCLAFDKTEISRLSSIMARKIINDFSLSQGKPFGIIVGEKHNKISDFLLELSLLSLAHSMGINHLLLEVPPSSYEEVQRDALASSFTSFENNFLLYKKIIFATYLGMKIIPIDMDNRAPSLKVTETCATIEEVFNEEREVAFCRNTLAHRNNFIMFLGHVHPSYFPNRCAGINEAYILSYLHLQPMESKEKIRNTLEALSSCKDYAYKRYRESVLFRSNEKVFSIYLKANNLLDPEVLLKLLMSGIIKWDEFPEEFL